MNLTAEQLLVVANAITLCGSLIRTVTTLPKVGPEQLVAILVSPKMRADADAAQEASIEALVVLMDHLRGHIAPADRIHIDAQLEAQLAIRAARTKGNGDAS